MSQKWARVDKIKKLGLEALGLEIKLRLEDNVTMSDFRITTLVLHHKP